MQLRDVDTLPLGLKHDHSHALLSLTLYSHSTQPMVDVVMEVRPAFLASYGLEAGKEMPKMKRSQVSKSCVDVL